MKHIKTFESFSYTENEILKEESWFNKPKDGGDADRILDA